MTKNNSATRYASQQQEARVAKKLGGIVNSNSGAGHFNKSDVKVADASLSIECKTSMTPKQSVSIKKEWIEKHRAEALSNGLFNQCIAFNYNFIVFVVINFFTNPI